MINDYPPPVLLNWGLNEGDPAMNGYDMTTGKIWGVLKYLRSLPREAENDIVITIDAHDVVFQLPLPILLSRYHGINNRVNERLARQHGLDVVKQKNITQTIIMGAEKYCWPLDHRHPACYAVPPSPLRPDAYGKDTDKSTETNRPRWLNSGTIVGPVRDMRFLYEWVHLLWRAYYTRGGDQDYFSYIYGMQELGRQKLRGTHDWVFGFNESFDEKDFVPTHLPVEHTDYHLGLDLGSEIFQAVNKAWEDLSPVVHENNTLVDERDRVHGTASIYQEHFRYPQDLSEIASPFQDLKGTEAAETEHLLNINWRGVPLFTNFNSRSIPVAMHHNGDKKKMEEWWHLLWWKGRGRDMKNAKERKMGKSGFWISTDSGHRLTWDQICADHQASVFVQKEST
ncbi:hypothetical protein MW887_004278 [Aspergillus wentii]|nr:hypothetical protein MW887_004278 [Aspergillus wentii]